MNYEQKAGKYESAEEFVRSADAERIYFNKVVEDINSKLPNKNVRITPNSVAVLKGNVRGNWIDNDDVWTFYPSKSIPEDFRLEVQKNIPNAKVMNGAIDFPKDSFPSITKSQLTDMKKAKAGTRTLASENPLLSEVKRGLNRKPENRRVKI